MYPESDTMVEPDEEPAERERWGENTNEAEAGGGNQAAVGCRFYGQQSQVRHLGGHHVACGRNMRRSEEELVTKGTRIDQINRPQNKREG